LTWLSRNRQKSLLKVYMAFLHRLTKMLIKWPWERKIVDILGKQIYFVQILPRQLQNDEKAFVWTVGDVIGSKKFMGSKELLALMRQDGGAHFQHVIMGHKSWVVLFDSCNLIKV
jgi:hypothetical protein